MGPCVLSLQAFRSSAQPLNPSSPSSLSIVLRHVSFGLPLLTESVLLFGLLQSCLVASNTVFILPVLAVFSASLAIWSIQFLLSLLSCFFTSLSLAWYSTLYAAFSLFDLVESTLALQNLLSSIFFQLVALIQDLLSFFLYPKTSSAVSLQLSFMLVHRVSMSCSLPSVLSSANS